MPLFDAGSIRAEVNLMATRRDEWRSGDGSGPCGSDDLLDRIQQDVMSWLETEQDDDRAPRAASDRRDVEPHRAQEKPV